MRFSELFLPDIQKIKRRKDTQALVRVLKNDSAKIRRAAAIALDELGWTPSTLEEKSLYLLAKQDWSKLATNSDTAVDLLVRQLQSENPILRKEASNFLGEIADPKAIQPLLQLYFAETTLRPEYSDKEIIIQNTLRSLEKTGPERVAPFLDKIIDTLLTSRSSNSSNQVFSFLGFGSNAARNSRSNVEMVARMGWIAFNPLIQAVRFNPDTRSGASEAISIMKDRRVIEALTRLLTDGDPFVRQTAANGLGNIPAHQAVPPLILMLEDEHHPVRSGAADALGKIGDGLAVGPLIKALKDQNSQVRSSAARALGEIGNIRAIDELSLLLSDPISGNDAAWALGEMGDPKALDALSRTASSKDTRLAHEATRAIEKIKHKVKSGSHSAVSD
jgi:HEAT repeat protein